MSVLIVEDYETYSNYIAEDTYIHVTCVGVNNCLRVPTITLITAARRPLQLLRKYITYLDHDIINQLS